MVLKDLPSRPIVVSLAVALGSTCVPAAGRASCDGVPFRVEDNRVFIDATVNGMTNLAFLVDTGSSGSTISAELQRRLALPTSGHGVAAGAGESRVANDETAIASKKFCTVVLATVPVASLS